MNEKKNFISNRQITIEIPDKLTAAQASVLIKEARDMFNNTVDDFFARLTQQVERSHDRYRNSLN